MSPAARHPSAAATESAIGIDAAEVFANRPTTSTTRAGSAPSSRATAPMIREFAWW